MTLTKHATAALAKVDEIKLEDFDFIGQKCPQVSAGHKAMIYLAIAVSSLPAQSAWAAMSLILVPMSVSVTAAAMAIGMLMKSAANDADDEPENNDSIDVDAEEVIGPATIEATAEPVYEPNPFASADFGKRYDGEVYASPEDKARATLGELEDRKSVV